MTHAVLSGNVQRMIWPTIKGRSTVNPSAWNTSLYIAVRLPVASLHGSKTSDLGNSVTVQPGVMNGPRMFPTNTSTIVAASSPPAALVMTTLEDIVVGRQARKIYPAKIDLSIWPFASVA
jgi:hypothetical protein